MQVTAMSFSEKRVKREIIVKASRPLSPLVRRITFGGDGLAELGATPPARWIKLFLPTGKGDEAGRAYTIRRYDAAAQEMEVDFVIHGDGPASRWAERASPGEVIAFGGPRGGFARHADAAWLLLAGDETGLPAILDIIESLPPQIDGRAFLEVEDEREQQAVRTAAAIEVTWLARRGAPAGTTDLLEAALRRARLPEGRGQCWIVGEAAAVRRLRCQLTVERGIPPSAVTAKGYWRMGQAGYKEREG
jgi:NADPH-dependent ferric siderophore reductase